ncbi:MAG: type II toxin-antitoxin system VapC family toxin [Mycobacteriales bacterium]
MRVVADSHVVVWYAQNSPRLSPTAGEALDAAEAEGGIVVSVATLVDLWYVTQTTEGVTKDQLDALQDDLLASPAVELHPVTVEVTDAYTEIARTVLSDPWDRFIVATAKALNLPLVTRDAAIRQAALVDTVW